MIKRMSIAAICFCGIMVAGSVLCGQDSDNGKHVIVGARALSEAEHAVQQETRVKLPLTDDQRDPLFAEVKVAASEETAAAAELQLSHGADCERVTQHDMFYTSHPGALQKLHSLGITGETIEFADGSVWIVNARDAYKTANWLLSDLIVVTPNRSWFSSYNFRLTNQDTGVSVQANLSLGPIYNSSCTHWIIAIDYYNHIIYLEDGSTWSMSYCDDSTIKKWVINDTVIIGINDGWQSYSKPNILINVNMLNYARGIVLN